MSINTMDRCQQPHPLDTPLGPTATVAKAGVKRFEDQPARDEAVKLGKLIAEILAKKESTSTL